jgi:tRNA1(Val) A37 N6-methylase TrmN6
MVYYTARDCIPKSQILSKFDNFQKNFQLKLIHSNEPIRHYDGTIPDSGITIINSASFNTDIITEYFIEDIRIQCKVASMDYSPIDYYKHHQKFIDNLFESTTKNAKYKNNKTTLYYQFRLFINCILFKFCDVFPLFVPLSIYSIFKPRKILDMSAGWGDRLIGALAYHQADYTGVDPNSQLQSRYKEMIEMFKGNHNQHEYKVIESGFENVELGDERYDMMFSSPPYFNAEEYSKNINQSFHKYGEIDSWLNQFMYVSVDKIWKHLMEGGFFIMVINDIKSQQNVIHFTQKIMDYVLTKTGASFIHMMKYKTPETVQPIWIFQKLPAIPATIFLKGKRSSSNSKKSKKEIMNHNITNRNVNRIGGKFVSSVLKIVEKTKKQTVYWILTDDNKNNKSNHFLSNISNKNNKNKYTNNPNNPNQKYIDIFLAVSYVCYILGKKLYIIVNTHKKNLI